MTDADALKMIRQAAREKWARQARPCGRRDSEEAADWRLARACGKDQGLRW